jgi:hypothetical protein
MARHFKGHFERQRLSKGLCHKKGVSGANNIFLKIKLVIVKRSNQLEPTC